MTIKEVPVEKIEVGERRRIDYGDIAGLARGIAKVGLLEPIIVDRNGDPNVYRLVAGERRLRAVLSLNWPTIPAQLRETLTEEELREIELEENENRKSLTEQERRRSFLSSKKLVENAKKAGEILSVLGTDKPLPRGHAPKHGTSREAIATDIGTTVNTLRKAEKHVEAAERFPFLQGADWRQSDALRITERLEELPEPERDLACGVLSCAKLLDPALAVTLVENIIAKKPVERQEIYQLSTSEDPRQQSLALTKAAQLPPMPDPRLGVLDNVLRILQAAIKPFPNDPITPRLKEVRTEIQKIRASVKEVSFDAQRDSKGETVQ